MDVACFGFGVVVRGVSLSAFDVVGDKFGDCGGCW